MAKEMKSPKFIINTVSCEPRKRQRRGILFGGVECVMQFSFLPTFRFDHLRGYLQRNRIAKLLKQI